MLSFLYRFAAAEGGATSIEYALIASFLSMAILTGATNVGGSLNSTFTTVNTGFSH